MPAVPLCALCLSACALLVHLREEKENQVGNFRDLRDTKFTRESCVTEKPLGNFGAEVSTWTSPQTVPCGFACLFRLFTSAEETFSHCKLEHQFNIDSMVHKHGEYLLE